MNPNLPFLKKTILVTGSGRGIGRAIALHFASLGADLIVNYVRNEQPARQVQDEIKALGRRVLLLRANVGKLEDIDRLFDAISAEFDGLDAFISNAAIGFNRPAMEQNECQCTGIPLRFPAGNPPDAKTGWRCDRGDQQPRRLSCPARLCLRWSQQGRPGCTGALPGCRAGAHEYFG
jgi:NAD(P)-dependent dehydrogenase (short-subunit alcohol dehydrogenase family)